MSTREDGISGRIESFGHEAVRNGWTTERFVLLGLLGLFLAGFGPSFQVYLLTEFLIIALFALAFNLLYGYTGLLSFGHALFYAGGSYGLAIFITELRPEVADAVGSGLAPLVTFAGGGLFGLLLVLAIAIPVGWLSVRLEEIYFALITLAFGMLGYSLILQNPGGLTNGTDGLLVLLGTIELGGLEIRLGDRQTYYYLTLATVLASTYAIWRIVHSPFGTICKSIRESPDRAAALGVDVRYHRWMTFILSAVFAGIAGVLIAGLVSVASPTHSHWTQSAIPVVATVIGGATYFGGPIIGAFVYLYVRWGISRFGALEAYWEFFFGLMLIVVVLYFKEGAAGGLIMLRDWLLDVRTVSERDGTDAAIAFVRDSIVTKLREAKDVLVKKGTQIAAKIRSAWNRVRSIGHGGATR